MKKKINFSFVLLCFALLLLLSSCKEGESNDTSSVTKDSVEFECVIGDSWNGVIYEDILYYTTRHGILRYYDLANTEAGSFPLNSDPLADGSVKDPSFVGGGFYAVSPKLTKENDGNHVLIYAQRYGEKDIGGSAFRLMKYDTLTNTTVKILDKIDIMMQSMLLYGDTVVFTVNNEKKGWDIYRVDIDGENYVKKDNPRKAQYRAVTIHGDRIYYADEKSGKLYSSSLMLDDEKELFSTNVSQIWPFIVDGYIYYASPKVNYVEYDGIKYPSYTLCRRPLDDLSKEEMFMENLSSVVRRGDKLFFDYTELRYVTETALDYSSPLYEYSFETGETRQIFDLSGTLKDRVWTVVGEDHIVFTEIDYSTGNTPQTRGQETIVHNLMTGEETVLPME